MIEPVFRAFVLLLACCSLLAGCGTPRTTRLTDEDMREFASALAEKLREGEWMRSRSHESPRAVIAMQKLENLTSDLMTSGEQWGFMSRVRSGQRLVELGREKNFVMVIPAEFAAQTQSELDAFTKRSATHELTASLRSATRAAALARTDVYLCDMRITQLADGSVLWTDTLAIKRQAFGRTYD